MHIFEIKIIKKIDIKKNRFQDTEPPNLFLLTF